MREQPALLKLLSQGKIPSQSISQKTISMIVAAREFSNRKHYPNWTVRYADKVPLGFMKVYSWKIYRIKL